MSTKKLADQVAHSVLGAYKSAIKNTSFKNNLISWEN